MKKQEIKLDALKLIAESYGFDLVEKKREIKVGDFGKFWDSGLEEFCDFGYLHRVQESTCPYINNGCSYRHFSHLTDAEKSQITENW